MNRSVLDYLLAGLLLAVPSAAQEKRVLPRPEPDPGLEMIPVRRMAQLDTLDQFEVVHDFQFTDRQAESGIRFQHHIVEDAGKHYKPVHYDHGNGIAVADVDGDSRYDIYFTTQLGRNELWRSRGRGRFEDITDRAGVGLEDRVSVTASFADYDNDGDPDLFVTTVRMGNVMFENDGEGNFRDVTEERGLEYVGHSSGAPFLDYDNDGHLDLFLVNVGVYTTDRKGPGGYYVGYRDAFSGHLMPERTERSILYRNDGKGSFRDVSEEAGLVDESWSGDAGFVDLNGDNFPDVYVLNMQGDDHYYESTGERTFVEKTASRFPKTPWGSMGIQFFDVNNDGLFDLFLTDMHSDMSYQVTPGYEKLKSYMTWSDRDYLQGGSDNIFGNALYINRGKGEFEEVSDEMGAENYWPWGLSTGDLNADGWEDVFITASMNFPYRYGVNTVLLNNRGKKLLDSEFILGVEPRKGSPRTEWFDLDCSGEDREHLFCRGRSGTFTIAGPKGSRASVLFDLDDDGDLDVVTNEFNSHPMVLVSDLAQRREIHWIQVELVGTASNRDGLGATVKVFTDSAVLTRYHDGKSGYLSQSSLPLYFGLGDATSLDRIEVLWPSGTRQTVSEGLEIDTTIEIVEG